MRCSIHLMGMAAALALVVGLAGCGGDGGDATTDAGEGGEVDAADHPPDASPQLPCDTDEECDHGADCMVGTCGAGDVCEYEPDDSACEDGNQCTTGTCTEQGCEPENVADDTACEDGGGNEGQCEAGVCITACTGPGDCNDGNQCTVASCSSEGICEYEPIDDVGCQDGVCSGGECVECTQPGHCQDGTECTDAACEDQACAYTPNSDNCTDGNQCTVGTCTEDGCDFTDLADGTECGEGEDTECVGGECIGCTGPSDCDDGIACTDNICNEDDACENPPDDGFCDDDNQCTVNQCTDAGCAESDAPEGAECDDGVCTQGDCVECITVGDCDDGVSCTVASCDGNQCAFDPDDDLCDDGNECTVNTCDGSGGCQTDNLDDVPCAGGAGTCEAGECEAPEEDIAAFRFDSLELQHPHVIVDKIVDGGFLGDITVCDDVTFDNLEVSGIEVAEGINPTLAGQIDDLELNLVGVLEPFSQVGGFEGDGALVDSDCPSESSCSPLPDGVLAEAPYSAQSSGSCMDDIPGIFGGTWPDGRTSHPNTTLAGDSGCYVSEAADLELEVEFADETITLPLEDGQLAGRFADDPAVAVEDGVIIGFLTQAAADEIEVTVENPVTGDPIDVNVGQDLLPTGEEDHSAACQADDELEHCDGPDARVTHDGDCGWWFALNFTGLRLDDASAYE